MVSLSGISGGVGSVFTPGEDKRLLENLRLSFERFSSNDGRIPANYGLLNIDPSKTYDMSFFFFDAGNNPADFEVLIHDTDHSVISRITWDETQVFATAGAPDTILSFPNFLIFDLNGLTFPNNDGYVSWSAGAGVLAELSIKPRTADPLFFTGIYNGNWTYTLPAIPPLNRVSLILQATGGNGGPIGTDNSAVAGGGGGGAGAMADGTFQITQYMYGKSLSGTIGAGGSGLPTTVNALGSIPALSVGAGGDGGQGSSGVVGGAASAGGAGGAGGIVASNPNFRTFTGGAGGAGGSAYVNSYADNNANPGADGITAGTNNPGGGGGGGGYLYDLGLSLTKYPAQVSKGGFGRNIDRPPELTRPHAPGSGGLGGNRTGNGSYSQPKQGALYGGGGGGGSYRSGPVNLKGAQGYVTVIVSEDTTVGAGAFPIFK